MATLNRADGAQAKTSFLARRGHLVHLKSQGQLVLPEGWSVDPTQFLDCMVQGNSFIGYI